MSREYECVRMIRLPILTAYPDLLHGKASGPINWVYRYAFARSSR